MSLSASAQGSVDGLSITCQIAFVATLQSTGAEARGTMGGEIQRSALRADGSGIAFLGDAYYPDIRIVVSSSGRAVIRSHRNGTPDRPTGESRFWDQLISFEGTYDSAQRTISGNWVCRPLDTRGDVTGDVIGTWTLR